jgi:hypothetical protein
MGRSVMGAVGVEHEVQEQPQIGRSVGWFLFADRMRSCSALGDAQAASGATIGGKKVSKIKELLDVWCPGAK